MARRELRLAGALLAFGGAAALAFACGSAARTAPPPKRATPDHAGGLLARASRDPSVVFGGKSYGATSYGGDSYANVEEGPPRLREPDDDEAFEGTRYGGYKVSIGTLTTKPRPAPYADYSPSHASGGTLEGRVRWRHPPRLAPSLPVTDVPGCPGPAANDTLTINRGGVAGAVVYLADIRRGRPFLHGLVDSVDASQRPRLGGTVVASGCDLMPRVQLMAPLGTALEITRRGPGARVIHGKTAGKPAFELELDHSGPVRELRVDTPGILELATDGGLAPAWVVVQAHPYYVVTDDNGDFLLNDVPPGHYRLTVWHPPVATAGPGGTVRWTAPVTRTVQVSVKATAPHHVVVDLGR